MLRFIVLPIALLFALALPVSAQTSEKTNKLADFLNDAVSELAQTKANLIQIARGLDSVERDRADVIYDLTTNMECYIDKLSMVATVHSLMVDNRDKATLKKYIGLLAKHSIKATDVTIDAANRELAKMQSPAAIAEVQKIRDLVQKLRDEIRRTIPRS